MSAESVYSVLVKKETAHDDPIYCCAWTKTSTTDDKSVSPKDFIVTGGLDCLVKVWLFENNKLTLVHTLNGHSMAIVSVAISPDGHTLATTSLDSSLIIWDLVSGQKVHEVQTGVIDMWKVVFSPDGYKLIMSGHNGKLVIFGLENFEQEETLDTRGKFALSVAWSNNGKYVAAGAADGTVCVFDVAQGKLLLHTIQAHTQRVRSVAFSPKSNLLVTSSDDGSVKIYNVASATLQCALKHDKWVVNACFSGDGTRVATADADGVVTIALADGLKVLKTFQEHTDTVWQVQFNGESNKLVSVSKDKLINIYECPAPPKQKTDKNKTHLIK